MPIKNLVIVESPAKAKTIEGYLGKDYVVKSSYGHVRDLPKGNAAIDIKNGFQPTYEISKEKAEVVRELKKLSKDAEMIWLATDDDREGEAISWHLKEALDLTDARMRRIVFREITKQAILAAIESPRLIDEDLVNAQQARRILDRLVGFELSPILWKKIKTGLSAGRVQSVAVRIVVEREREIEHFQVASSYKVTAEFLLPGKKVLQADLPKKFKTEAEALAFLEKCNPAEFSIDTLEKKPAKRSPAAPFTTSTLQQEAGRKLGMPVGVTMSYAQRLYEAGKITYMRTDSVSLSNDAKAAAKAEISSAYGPEFSEPRNYATKSKGAQEAHEAIRPTNFAEHTAGNDSGEQRLYDLIWKRAIASQMADAQLERTTAAVAISTTEERLVAHGEVVTFEGFLKVYLESKDDEDDEEQKGMLPPLTVGQKLDLDVLKATERFTRPAARYTEASLVKQLEELGIGRPSTYAPTISTVQKRGYVLKESRDGHKRDYRELRLAKGAIAAETLSENTGAEKNKLFPTDLAMIVNDFLVDHFPKVTDYSFTANVEEELDDIAHGKLVWGTMLSKFYGEFHDRVEDTEQIERSDVKTSKVLGVDPKTGLEVIARLGRYGPLVQLGPTPDPETEPDAPKPKMASLKKGQLLETLTLEDAMELFKLPREIGEFEGEKMVAAIGRFGPYIKYKSLFVSIPQGEDPLDISAERSIELVKEKIELEANKYIKTFDENPEIQVLNGRYGPYIKAGKQNVKIPKDKEPADLTLEECLALAEEAKKNPPKRRGNFKKK